MMKNVVMCCLGPMRTLKLLPSIVANPSIVNPSRVAKNIVCQPKQTHSRLYYAGCMYPFPNPPRFPSTQFLTGHPLYSRVSCERLVITGWVCLRSMEC